MKRQGYAKTKVRPPRFKTVNGCEVRPARYGKPNGPIVAVMNREVMVHPDGSMVQYREIIST